MKTVLHKVAVAMLIIACITLTLVAYAAIWQLGDGISYERWILTCVVTFVAGVVLGTVTLD